MNKELKILTKVKYLLHLLKALNTRWWAGCSRFLSKGVEVKIPIETLGTLATKEMLLQNSDQMTDQTFKSTEVAFHYISIRHFWRILCNTSVSGSAK